MTNLERIIIAIPALLLIVGCDIDKPTPSGTPLLRNFENVIVYTLLGESTSPLGEDRILCEIHAVQGNVDHTLFSASADHRSDISASPAGDKVVYVEGISPSSKIGGMMNYYGVPDYPHQVLTTSDGATERQIVSSDEKIFMLPKFSLNGLWISVVSMDTSFSAARLEIYDTTGIAVFSTSFPGQFVPHWITDNTVICLVLNENGDVGSLEKINIETGSKVETQLATPVQTPVAQLFRIQGSDTLLFCNNDGYFYYSPESGAFGSYAKLAAFSMRRVMALKDTQVLAAGVPSQVLSQLVVYDVSGNLLDSLQYEGYVKDITSNYWNTKTYIVSEVGDDSQNLYEVSFSPRLVRKITSYGSNCFLVNLGHNLQ